MTDNGDQPQGTPPALLGGVDADGIIDLTPPADQLRPKRFRVGPHDDDIFTAAASVPVLVGARGTRLLQGPADDEDGTAAADRTVAFLLSVLYEEDRDRFRERLEDLRNPIDHRLLFAILRRLLEEWGLRPTEPSEPSSDGASPPAAGTTSTAAPPSPATTSPASASTGS
jgi:hypothetical protein